MKIAAYHGYEQIVCIARREGDDGATNVTYAGLTARDRLVAEAIAGDIKRSVLGWESSDEAKALEAMVKEAKREMQEGPDGDVERGKRMILPTIERVKEVDGAKHSKIVVERASSKRKLK